MKKSNKSLILVISGFCILILISYSLISFTGGKNKNQKAASLVNEKEDKNNKHNDLTKNKENNNMKEREFKGNNLMYNDKTVPVIMYHSIDYEKGNELRVPKEAFKEQMRYLKEKGYTTLTLNEFYSFLTKNKPIPDKSVVITFDDGYKDNYVNAYPILKEFGFNATIFVITSTIDTEKDYLTTEQLKELQANGIDIQSHTVNHDQLDKLPYVKQVDTLKSSKDNIEKKLGNSVKYIGYPFGKWNEDTIKAAKDAGYNMAFTTTSGWSDKNQGMYKLRRVYISANHNLKEFERRLTNENYNK